VKAGAKRTTTGAASRAELFHFRLAIHDPTDWGLQHLSIGRDDTILDVGCVIIQEASVSALPFADNTFDLVTAIETHFWWENLSGGMRERRFVC
jgi:methyltransferase family protein